MNKYYNRAPVERLARLFIHINLKKKWKGQRVSPLGLKLAWEEREQEYDNLYYLLVAQLKLYRQFKHGINLVCAGLQANC